MELISLIDLNIIIFSPSALFSYEYLLISLLSKRSWKPGGCWIKRMGETQKLFLKTKKTSENINVGQLVVNNGLQTKDEQ